jgi:hypothetical protein
MLSVAIATDTIRSFWVETAGIFILTQCEDPRSPDANRQIG